MPQGGSLAIISSSCEMLGHFVFGKVIFFLRCGTSTRPKPTFFFLLRRAFSPSPYYTQVIKYPIFFVLSKISCMTEITGDFIAHFETTLFSCMIRTWYVFYLLLIVDSFSTFYYFILVMVSVVQSFCLFPRKFSRAVWLLRDRKRAKWPPTCFLFLFFVLCQPATFILVLW